MSDLGALPSRIRFRCSLAPSIARSQYHRRFGFEVIRDGKGSENGYCDFLEKRIAVRSDVSQAQAVKTMIHELGHGLLHSERPIKSREVAEVEVESVAYIVCNAIGLETGEYSFPYVTRWAEGDIDLLKETAQRVTECAAGILVRLEGGDVRAA